ncbi:hypothetical protein DET48_10386 [Vibrio diazotrophicus]|uniref:Uncharacterized protein n=1 Tax=Vibrio diazotrophicus TaxID=685 RepID=A0A329EF51_VIBDI|nr:hypothetical protein DET48_10386 [Vibrio diazotrophicus]
MFSISQTPYFLTKIAKPADAWKRFHDYGFNHRKFFSFAYDIEN